MKIVNDTELTNAAMCLLSLPEEKLPKLLQAEKPDDYQVPERVRSPWTTAGAIYRVATFAWHCGATPGGIVRLFGPFARRFTQGYAERRMHQSMGLPREECSLFEPYMFHTLGARGSGEVLCTALMEMHLSILWICPGLHVSAPRTQLCCCCTCWLSQNTTQNLLIGCLTACKHAELPYLKSLVAGCSTHCDGCYRHSRGALRPWSTESSPCSYPSRSSTVRNMMIS